MVTRASVVRLSTAAGLVLGCHLDAAGLGGSTSTTTGTSASDSPTTTASTRADTTGGSTDVATMSGSASTGDPTGPDDGDSSSSDTGEPAPWPVGPFGDPVPVDVLNLPDGTNDDDPSLTADQLLIVFGSNRSSSDDIFMAERKRVDDDWGQPSPIDAVNSNDTENTPEVSADGLILMFGSTRRGIPFDMDVYISYRADRGDDWGPPQLVEDLSSPLEDISPTTTFGLEEIYVCSRRSGISGSDIYRASITQSGGMLAFGSLQPVMELGTFADDCTVALSPDRRVIFYDTSASGIFDLMTASRDEPDQEFTSLEPLDELNLPTAQDMDPWISPDGHVLNFSSTRTGDQDIYYAVR